MSRRRRATFLAAERGDASPAAIIAFLAGCIIVAATLAALVLVCLGRTS